MAEPEDLLPRGVSIAWGIAENPQRGPKRELTIERIVEVAIEIADAEGLAAVSMARVAGALGYTTMSLYRYVTSKDDLLVLMQDAASEVPVPAEGSSTGWREGVTRWALAARQVYRAHPWLNDIPTSGVPMTPNTLLMADWMLGELEALPLSANEKISTLLLLSSYIRAMSGIERDMSRTRPSGGEVDFAAQSAALAALVTPERFPHLSPIVSGGAYTGDPNDGHDDFAFGLGRILDGVAFHVAQRDAGRAGADPSPSEPADLEIPRDKAVREAAKARREVEGRLREALKREREAIKKVREREREAAKREAEAAKREAEKQAAGKG
ncbi:TetR/AcrR family transcriptional regulator [Rathayibacter sp. YIM 133350]|uniref:TetR/AcrR family transcriptional regulator n=1 Tax=Rathayibacter sp. YIM 133350 TaxID=3131992 RepID=UPI00307D5016